MTKEQFVKIKEKYGEYSSFAIWASHKNVSDTSMFNDEKTCDKLNTDYVFVALNPAERPDADIVKPFSNFHSDYSFQKDFKLCYALQGTKLWGSYITDLFKSFKTSDSNQLNKMLKDRPEDIEKDKETFIEELSNFDCKVVLIALGRKTEKYLKKLVGDRYRIVYLQHYSFYCSKESYKKTVLKTINEFELF